jgi:hypothetical protein
VRDRELKSIRAEILSEIEGFAGKGGVNDDRTLILVRREE